MDKNLKKPKNILFGMFMLVLITISCGCMGGAATPVIIDEDKDNGVTINNSTNTIDNNLDKNVEYIEITDMAGRIVKVPKKVNRVIGLGSSLREVIYLGAKDKVVGVEVKEGDKKVGTRMPYIAANKELMDLTQVSKASSNYYYERIIKVKPDVIFIGFNAESADDIQEKVGIPVVVTYINPTGTGTQNNKYRQSLRLMGKILDKEERAEEILSKMKEYKTDLALRASKSDKKPSIYVAGRVFGGVTGLTTTDPHLPSFEFLGSNNRANNVAYNISEVSNDCTVNKEQLISWNPEYIFANSATVPKIAKELKRPEFKSLRAVSENKMYTILPYCWYGFNEDNALANSYYIGKVLYPEQFEDIDPIEKADEIHTFFNGKPVYNELSEYNLKFGKWEAE
ncbi:ABC transporter substrate-binding protein [Methanococcus voltae]|uniref:Iron complex transport system substrate-binding protein n=2 Tax=Methanococcus voltae TaxID=2188 RepID=A0A8J7URR8_METVO|nr:ABC transporter substrate-binding protein [Methanococcus voltae]MBP2173145.1 iron complex transport system substrate-binding protein [Methanococcus voltae]MBP2202063.1 iron complex transport system substrate-binding protein [Methanococcus voltae]MCS3922848.1 iron complex transport system substrate-binding protein [Methanococcus voltae PS]